MTYPESVRTAPFTGRVYLMFVRENAAAGESPAPRGGREPRFGPDWFDPQPFFSQEVTDWKPDETLTFGNTVAGLTGPLGELAAGAYRVQAIMRSNLDSPSIGRGSGNIYSTVRSVTIEASNLAGETPAPQPISLKLDQVVAEREFPSSARLKTIELRSRLLSDFYGRDVLMHAAVVLPPDFEEHPDARYPALYVIPGFGGDHRMAQMFMRMGAAKSAIVKIVLDPSAYTGHHVFADSENNGPRGRALVEEFIPYIEEHFRVERSGSHRYLTGMSSGGWSSLWLQVTYPDVFAGVWSFSPDPVDFRDFQGIDIYADGANMFRDAEGKRRPLARRGEEVMIWYDAFAAMDEAIGLGGQLRSFDAVFSPKGADGHPSRLWDPRTGAIDPAVAKAWQKYDIRLVLERNWPALKDKLAGKLHIIVGDRDTFYLEGAVKRLAASLKDLGSDAEVVILPGVDHGGSFSPARLAAIDQTITERFAKKDSEGLRD
ncbi:MAG TPA: alpha/beta hydrolase-fold protein [Phycisphaerae bacterium]